MARAGVLYEEVKREADEMLERGISPTMERLRQALGGGSFSTLSRHLRAWRGGAEGEMDAQEVEGRSAESSALEGALAAERLAEVERRHEALLAAERQAGEERLKAAQRLAQEQASAAEQVFCGRLARSEA